MKKSLIPVVILALLGIVSAFSQEIVINEFQASNASTVSDPDFGAYADWIELYNTTDQVVDLGGWYLTDNIVDTTQWVFPSGVTMDPGAYLVVWADGEDVNQTDPHTNFRLSIGGESIGLFDETKAMVDTITFGKQIEDIS